MAPCDQTTDATGILAFLRDGAPVLEEAGFGVMAPPWWRSSRAHLALRLKARTNSKIAASTGTIGLEGLCDIRWEAVLGDDKLGLEQATGGLPVAAVEADGWLGDLLAGADDRHLRSIPTPDGFAGELRPYQERGLGWLAFLGDLGLGACLADDMGLGKTAQLLALLVDELSL